MDRREALKKSALFAGISLSAGSVVALMQGCQSNGAADWNSEFVNPNDRKIISAMVDVILPKTDTPSGTELQVDQFVDLMFEQALSPEDQQHVKTGFEQFKESCQTTYGKSFDKLNDEDQIEFLKQIGDETNHFNPSIWGSALGEQQPVDFYRRFRQFTLLGYFTSEAIGKNVLAFDPIPGEYNGCIDLRPDQKAWTI